MRILRAIIAGAVGVIGSLAAAPSRANVTYEYTGNHFEVISSIFICHVGSRWSRRQTSDDTNCSRNDRAQDSHALLPGGIWSTIISAMC